MQAILLSHVYGRGLSLLSRWCLVTLVVAFFVTTGVAQPASPVNTGSSLLSFERMGTGAPAGWKVDGRGNFWASETTAGPLGPGAAKVTFHEDGSLKLSSPARAMREGQKHVLALWLRSEPAGIKVQVEVQDNDNNAQSFLKDTFTAGTEWQLFKTQGVLGAAFKGRYYLKVEASATNARLWLDGLWLGEIGEEAGPEWHPSIHPAGVRLEPGMPWGVVTGGEPLRINAHVVTAVTQDVSLKLRAVNTSGVTADLPSIDLGNRGIWNGSVKIDGALAATYGMVRVEGTVVDANGQPLSPMAETLLTRVPEPIPGPLPESYFGIHVSPREPDAGVVAKLGYKWCRMHDASGITKWGHIEPEMGKWLWHDEDVGILRRRGLSIVGMLDSAPVWETGADPESGYFSIYHAPKNLQNWRQYVHEIVEHYAGVIDEWEVWNEPWDMQRFFQGGSPDLYTQLLKAAYEEAKGANPLSTVIGIDTYPEMWDTAVLAAGAYPYYDMLSWHHYDPTLQGRPNDGIARETGRLCKAQEKYGEPKPVLCTEGGPDVTVFQGSFFSFADPVLMGDWSEGTDRYTRMFLSMIAAGNRRFIAYSLHNDTYHGWLTHMMCEPGYLMRPIHAGLAALAHFVDGAKYETCLTPAQDISAQVFQHPHKTPGVEANSTVVVLCADGSAMEDLPCSIPAGIQCFDRWANPVEPPTQVGSALVYLVANANTREELLRALQPIEISDGVSSSTPTLEGLLNQALSALTAGKPELWSLFSSQGSLLVLGGEGKALVARRAELRSQPDLAARFHFPAGTTLGDSDIRPAGEFTLGSFSLTSNERKWSATFVAVRDGLGGGWRFTSLSILRDHGTQDTNLTEPVKSVVKKWEEALLQGTLMNLPGTLAPKPACLMAATATGGYYVFDDPVHLLAMMNTAVLYGPLPVSRMEFSRMLVSGDTATVMGDWNLSGLAFGTMPYRVTATLFQQDGGWKIAALCVSVE